MAYELEPQQRKEIYEWLLATFEEDVRYETTSGFCALLAVYDGPKGDISYYPELTTQKPEKQVFGCYWWPIGKDTKGRKRRMEALQKALRKVNKLL